MAFGLLFTTDGHQDRYLPVFCGDRELAYSVFVDAMKTCEKRGERDRVGELLSFYPIVEKLGKERRGTGPVCPRDQPVPDRFFRTVSGLAGCGDPPAL
jgi:hypothetical protein